MYKINKRPKFAESDDEDNYKIDDEQPKRYKINRRPKDDITDEIKEKETCVDIVNIFLWCEWDPIYEYHVGSHCHSSYSFASLLCWTPWVLV